jgi:potassium-dependent mechanosensitive channel
MRQCPDAAGWNTWKMMDDLKKMSCAPRALGAMLALYSIVAGHAGIAAGLTNPGLAAVETPAATAPGPASPEPVAAGDIPMRADEDERFAQDALVRARRQDGGQRLGAELDAIATGILNLSQASRKEDLERLPVIRLESLASHWRFYDRQLTDWRRDLDRVTTPYSEYAAQLAQKRAVWEATLSALAAGGVTSALSDRVEVILDQLALAERALAAPMDAQFQLRRRANKVQSSIEAGARSVEAAIAYYDRRLGMIDAVPVWQSWNDTRFSAQEMRDVERGLRLESSFIREWSTANQYRLLGYKAGAVALLPLLLLLAYRSRRKAYTEPEMQAAARVIRRPVSAWLLLTLIGVVLVFPNAPLVMHQLAMLLALIPMLRLLPQKVFQVLGPWPYVGTALYLLYRLGFLLLGQPLFHRSISSSWRASQRPRSCGCSTRRDDGACARECRPRRVSCARSAGPLRCCSQPP